MTFHAFTFEHDNPCDTRILDEHRKVVYSVITDHGLKPSTHIRNAQEEVIAWSEWRDVLPDKITLGSGRPMSLSSWLHRSLTPLKE